MKQNIFKKLMLIALLLTSNAVWAYDFESDGIYYYLDGNNTATVTYRDVNYNSYTGDIVIPETVTKEDVTYSVTSIGGHAFYNCSGLTSVTIPNSVTSIGNEAFSDCSGLTSVTIGNSVTSIGNHAFSGCSGLTSVTIPNSVTSIGNSAFSGCSGLTSVTIPNSVTSISEYTFCYCSGLTSVTIPNSVTSIGRSAFSDCSGLTSVTIPNSVTSIGNEVFSGCSSLTSVIIPNSVTSIGNNAFSNCSGLKSVTIPNSVTSIGEGAFSKCSGLTSVTIPNSVTSIGRSAFRDCSGLTSVTIPNSVTSIGNSAFSGCSGLTSVTIPNSVTSIGNYAFYSCNELTSVTIPNSVTSIGEYAFYSCNELTSVYISKSVNTISNYAFLYCFGLTSVTFESTTPPIIGERAFDGVSNATFNTPSLISVLAYKALEELKDKTFASHKVDGIYYLPTSDTEVEVTFKDKNYNSYAGDVVIPSEITVDEKKYKVTSIVNSAFYKCSGLTYIELPSTITNIGGSAFASGYNNSTNSYDYITRTIKCNTKIPPTLSYNVFDYNNLTLEVPFESIPDYQAVEGWTKNFTGSFTYKSKEVDGIYYFPTSETEVEVVSNPSKYTGDVVIPAEITVDEKKYQVTSIASSAFDSSKDLTAITIPNSVVSIGGQAFVYCTGLTSICIPEGVQTIDDSAFYGCSNLKSIELPSTITSIGANAFYNVSATFKVPFASALAYKAFDELKNKTFEGQNINGLYYLPTSETEVEVTLNPTKYSGDIVIPDTISVDSIKYKVTSIGYRAFYNCSNLTSIDIPESVSFIGPNAFVNCSSLTSLTIPSNVDYFDKHCCSGCSSLKTLIISDSEKELDFGGFITPEEVWEGLGGLPTINGWCFYGGDGSELFIDCPIDTLYIGRPIFSYSDGSDYNNDGYAALFASVSTIANVTLSEKLTSISDDLFKYCYKLTSITIPDSVTSIGCNAFYGCNSLTYIELPGTITSIGGSAFAISHYYYDENGNYNYRENITRTIKCNAKTPPTLVNNVFNCNYLTLEVPFESIPDYKAVEAWTTMEDGSITYKSKEVDGIYYLPMNDTEVEVTSNPSKYSGNVEIPSEITVDEKKYKVTSIGNRAFYNSENLISVTVPNTVASIGSNAFSYCI